MNTDSVRSCRDRLWRPANVTVTFIFTHLVEFHYKRKTSGCERKRADYNRIWFNSQLSLASNLFSFLTVQQYCVYPK
jgi:hypothetical protein